MTPDALTPVEKRGTLHFKRDDRYAPFGMRGVNGGKLRQCMMLVEEVLSRHPKTRGLITYCSIHSPQAPITAAAARHFELPCIICYGGTRSDLIHTHYMPRLARRYGADIRVIAASGRHTVLHKRAHELARSLEYFVVDYGINLDEYGGVLLGAVSAQVQNIPAELDDMYITCGSGITSSGVLVGLKRFGKHVERVHLMATGFDRRERIDRTLATYGAVREYTYHDMFHEPGFSYEKCVPYTYGGIELHPNYEAKSLRYAVNHGMNLSNALFWIVGAQPKEACEELNERQKG